MTAGPLSRAPGLAAAAPFAACAAGIATFALMDALMKDLTLSYGAVNAVFWRLAVGAVISGALFFGSRTAWPASRAAWRMHIVRGLITTVTATAFFYGLGLMPLADAIALSFMSPILIVIFAALMLKERIRPTTIVACVLGIIGVLIIIGGQLSGIHDRRAMIGATAILVSAVAYALQQVLLRHQAQTEPQLAITFIPPLIAALVLSVPVSLAPRIPVMADWPLVIASAVLTVISLLLITWAYKRAQAQKMAPLEYTAFPWAALFGYLMFHEQLTMVTLAGTILIIGACLMAMRSTA